MDNKAQTEDIGDINKKSVKRKKKRSSNQMAKKFARRRPTSDHGSELEIETYQYMVKILDILRTEFPKMDDKEMFANNVYEQMVDNEIACATNQVASRVLDSLMSYVSFEAIKRLADALESSLRRICCDRFASHVLEKIIQTCAERGNKSANSSSANDKTEINNAEEFKYNEIAMKLCKYVINNMEEFIFDLYANPVLRVAIKCLGGYFETIEGPKDKVKSNTFVIKRFVVQEYTDLLINTAHRLLNWPQFQQFGRDELTSGLLQTILQALNANDRKMTDSFIKKIIECFTVNEEGTLSNIFDCESSIRLLETCLAVSEPKMYNKLHKKYFVKKLGQLALTKNHNFAVQRLLDHCPSKEAFEEIFDEISEYFLPIVEKQFTGVLVSLANGCLRLKAKQGSFINTLSKCLDCESSDRQLLLVPLISSLITYNQFESARKSIRNVPVHLHGSLVLQSTLKFNKPIKIVNSMIGMDGEDLVKLLSDPKGSRILDAFMDSEFVGEKSRDKLLKKIKGNWVALAHGIHGSRCIDKMWKYAKTTQKIQAMEELASVGQSLNSTTMGKLIGNKLNVPLFARNKQEWLESKGKQEKTKALFANIINSTSEPVL